MLDFQVLGPFEVLSGSRLVDLGPRKQRAVLCALAVNANRVVSLDRLIDDLWGEHAPSQVIGTLQAYISNLRRALEPDRRAGEPPMLLVTQSPGYILRIPPEALDSHRFEEAAREGRQLLTEGRPASASRKLRGALELWRGAAYADFAFEPFAQSEAVRLEELRLAALEDRLQAELDLGNSFAAAAELEAAVAEHPMRERLRAMLMLALYRCGRQADALRAYQDARNALVEELGIDPGPALKKLEHDILAQDPSLDWRAPQPEPAAGLAEPSAAQPSSRPATESSAVTDVRPLVGRSKELARLEAAVGRARVGQGGAVLVIGEPGIGKTRLIEELVARAEAGGFGSAWGGALEGGGTPAYWPWVGVIRDLMSAADAAMLTEAMGLGASELAQVVPEVKEITGPLEAPPALDPETARLRLFEAIGGVLVSISRRLRPLVVVLDDLQWADVASLQLLGFLAPRLRASSLLVLGTYRPAEVGPAHPLAESLAALSRHQVSDRIELSGLEEGDVAELITARTGTTPRKELVRTVTARSEGNPFFVAELARLLASDRAEDDAALATQVPAGVRDVVRRRLAKLPEQTQALLGLAAVLGRDFDITVLERAAELEFERTLELVEAALLTGIVLESQEVVGSYRFSHDLVRETILEGLTAMRRARMHARVGEALQNIYGSSPAQSVKIAHHFLAAVPAVEEERAIDQALRAAQFAISRLAYEQAEQLLRRALALASRVPNDRRAQLELRVLIALGYFLMMVQGYAAREPEEIFLKAEALCGALGDSPELVQVEFGLLSVSLVRGRHREARAHADRLLQIAERTGEPSHMVAAHDGVGVVAFHQGQFEDSRKHLELALNNEDGLYDPWLVSWFAYHPVVMTTTFLSTTLWIIGEQERAMELSRYSVEFAKPYGQSMWIMHSIHFIAWLEVVAHDPVAARGPTKDALEFSHRSGFPFYQAMSRVLQGWVDAASGDPEGGAREIVEGLEAMQAGGAGFLQSYYLSFLAEAQLGMAKPDEALATIDRAIAFVELSDERFYEAELHRLRGMILLALDAQSRREEAVQELNIAVQIAERQGAASFAERARRSLQELEITRGSAPA
jgi:DNA-binding SARP family transcriptional activator